MRATTRFWGSVALGGTLTALALLLDRPVSLVGAAGIGAWLLARQSRFDRRTRRTMNDLSVSQTSSRERVVKDEPFAVTVEAALDRPSPLDVEIRCDPAVSVSGVSDDERRCELSRGERSATTTMTASGTVAGRVTFGRPEIRLTDPSGLFSKSLVAGEPVEVHIEPRTPRQLHVGAGGEQLTIGYGERDTIHIGSGQESTGVREYVPGDEMRHIDWKATARLNHPHVREYEQQTPRRTALLVDHRASMGVGRPGERKLDYARDLALLLLRDARAHEDPVSLYTVGDEGVTAQQEFGTGTEHYNELRRRLLDLTPTSNPEAADGDQETLTHTARARRLADRFAEGTTPFDRTLRPYVAERDAYVRRLGTQPLFSTVQAHAATLRSSTWTILVTDDSDRAGLRDTVKLARRGDGHVAVFVTPTVLFDGARSADPKSAYRRYREFEQFRQKIANMDGVTAFEVGPGDRIEAILSVGRNASGRPTDGTGRRRAGGVR
ncbi:Uncharacterized conserved protein, DUF58 family, contains vWF domain [Halopelagius inordinatus]|uniref:Uncharacterized conserved protein, DUF58 family, contains vWF domain n=1 Tax=Halopelagius inordinatus TaxID=553467 RepID=A0A1I2U6B7_9EURY|nr:DUF58 domain-containing protein [Halopelagius inordinatus]SFG72618.1 Uncharacterized conserved protein, DUF58 family, contains vWF domain [Halopelagius inordinatus]